VKLILVIEDDSQFRSMLCQMLSKAGYKAIDASNGKEGLELFRRKAPDLVITDLIMPEKEGLETIIELRRDAPHVKIIAISGGGMASPEDYLVLARKLGVQSVMAKPFSREEILEEIQRALNEKGNMNDKNPDC
jgi:CheY-like chemotaxis protein